MQTQHFIKVYIKCLWKYCVFRAPSNCLVICHFITRKCQKYHKKQYRFLQVYASRQVKISQCLEATASLLSPLLSFLRALCPLKIRERRLMRDQSQSNNSRPDFSVRVKPPLCRWPKCCSFDVPLRSRIPVMSDCLLNQLEAYGVYGEE